MITKKEYKILKAIIFNEFQPGGSPVGKPIWTDCLYGVNSNLTKSGVFGSLVKKGFVGTDDNSCWITYTGLKAYNDFLR